MRRCFRDPPQRLPCPSLPRCVPCSVPGHLLWRMPASWLPCSGPCDVGTYGRQNSGKFEVFF
ncbi:unnamed protein product [Staurois parvus]|uniref:Uncharacterized protein n=1 Tax=Staurois parvus TaxID=386267 RepID=A0ABN9F610_9NEOB|nr:unnamed protein product [Staurois parvus]